MKRAFTLIEVIIVTAMIALLAVASIPSLTTLQKRQAVETDLNVIESCFLEAMTRAKSPSSSEVELLTLVYETGTNSCVINERVAGADVEIARNALSGTDYQMYFPNQSTNQGLRATIEIKTQPPYGKTYVDSTGSNFTVELRESGSNVGQTSFNLDFGTVL